MGIRIPLQQLVVAVEQGATKRLEDAPVAWKYRMTCARLMSAVMVEYQRFSKLRMELVRKYRGKEITPNVISVAYEGNEENVAGFTQAINELLSSPIDLPLNPISVADLGESCGLTVADMRLLGPLLVD